MEEERRKEDGVGTWSKKRALAVYSQNLRRERATPVERPVAMKSETREEDMTTGDLRRKEGRILRERGRGRVVEEGWKEKEEERRELGGKVGEANRKAINPICGTQ